VPSEQDKRTPEVGERWAYRARAVDRLDEVEVVRFGSKSPPRVLIRFAAPEHEGREDWVPPGRLKVPWEQQQAFLTHERRWADVRAVAYLRETAVGRAIGLVFDNLPDWEYARDGYNDDTGVLMIHDVEGLLADLDLERSDLEHPLNFVDGDMLIAPWPVAEKVVRRLAERRAMTLLPLIDAEERQARRRAQFGDYAGDHHISAEICAEVDAEFAESRAVVRQWCGQENRDRHDELVALRVEVRRLGELVEQAVSALRGCGAIRDADRIERELGVPIDVIRAERDQRR
jgi:hypothetical protein